MVEKKIKIIKTNEEWRKILTPLQYKILREKGTERAGYSNIVLSKKKGVYHCVACNNPLFSSEDKYVSGTGWPSFTKPLNKNNIVYNNNPIKIKIGSEVLCARCEGHLGHVFSDGPAPLGLRFCMNGEVLKLKSK
jgi:peptide-methionine (R)-S-oxide reductase